MPYFFIVPLWLLTALVGAVMVAIRPARRAGVYVLTISTFATFVSFVFSTAVLFIGPRITENPPGWFGLMVVAGYLAAIPIGGLAGAVAGFLITPRLLAQARRVLAP